MSNSHDPLEITNAQELLELLAKNRAGDSRMINQQEMRDSLLKRVRGQDPIIDGVSQLIRLQWGKQQRDRPIANLMFVGPPATGKTELCAAMSEYLYGDAKSMLHFDCTEFSALCSFSLFNDT